MTENFVEEENLGISSDQQKEKMDSLIHCLNLGASNIILVAGTTYLLVLEGLDNWIAICLSMMQRRGIVGEETWRWPVAISGVVLKFPSLPSEELNLLSRVRTDRLKGTLGMLVD